MVEPEVGACKQESSMVYRESLLSHLECKYLK